MPMNIRITNSPKSDRYRNLRKGFTLVELLIVMAIIGVLASLSLFALGGARKQGRDVKRKADLETIRSAVELFRADCNVYPVNSCVNAPGSQLVGTAACGCSPANTNVYIQSIPDDPTAGQDYSYARIGTGVTYRLWTLLEDPPASAPTYCTSAPSCTAGTCNFCVINP